MVDSFELCVKSKKIGIEHYQETVTACGCMAHHASWTLTARNCACIHNVMTDVEREYEPEDQEAINLLEKAGISYKLVDLSKCFYGAQLKAKITRINKTPTLVLDGRRIKGVQSIKQTLHEIKDIHT